MLKDLLAELPENILLRVDVDVSHLWDRSAGSVIFTYQEPDIPQSFVVMKDAELLRRRNPTWTPDLAVSVASLAMAHRAPDCGDEPAGTVYESMVRERPHLFAQLLRQFMAAFPDYSNPAGRAEEKKSSCGPELTD